MSRRLLSTCVTSAAPVAEGVVKGARAANTTSSVDRSRFVPLPESDTYDHRMSDCEMTHVNVHGKAKMVDVTHKQPTVRIAMAEASINVRLMGISHCIYSSTM